ncbi:MAG: DNA polymerase, partial [Chloroflexota bacterium]|nr:DNA polymerase [Chloroflexota bacterium]
ADGTLAILEEGIFHDDLPERDPAGFAVLRAVAADHPADVEHGRDARPTLRLLARREFLDAVLWPAIQADALIVGFNLPFDLSRLAADVSPARGAYQGGFSFALWEYRDESGTWRENKYRPRLRIKHIDAKRALIGLARPKGWRGDFPRPGFLDLRTLSFALTDRSYSLRSACVAFGVGQGKADPGGHGRITPEYVAYARQDVAATASLLVALREDYDRHPIDLDPCRAFSPATIAKAYYRTMGVRPRLDLQPDFPRAALGQAMAAYYGGRAETAIRRTPVPVVYTDVLSMYPTVNALMGLWRLHVAERVEVEDCTEEARAVLAGITPDTVLDPATWPRLAFFGQIVPDGDVLPVRAQYGDAGGARNIGVNPFTDGAPHWYAGPDLAASALLTGKAPAVLRAWRPVAKGTQPGLVAVALGGAVPVDPERGDFFRTVIEERKRTDPATEEGRRLGRFLKVLANSGAYGIFVESNPEELPAGESAPVAVYGPDDSPFAARAQRPETPGPFSFPPVAALITAGARLVLALVERLVTDAGGVHAFCDTDSMAIVATEAGGLVPCPGGPFRLPDGREAVRALSWAEVDGIVSRLAALNPYDRATVPGSILKVEDANYDPSTGERRQLWCVSIAAKRYALFTLAPDGTPTVAEHTRHGLGFLLDPSDPDDGEADPAREPVGERERWEAALWAGIVRDALGLPTEAPPWADRPAVARLTVSSPWHLEAFGKANARKPYADRVKPFNFMLSAPPVHQGRPLGVPPRAPFRLVEPYETDPRRWAGRRWTDLYSGRTYRVTTAWPGGGAGVAGVQSLGGVAAAYPFHPEPKRLGPDGKPCHKQTAGLLRRRPVRAAGLLCIGKEAHRLEERPIVADPDALLNVYADPTRGPWDADALPRLRALAAEPGGVTQMTEACGLKPRALRDVLAGRSTPRAAVRTTLAGLLDVANPPPSRLCPGCGASLPLGNSRRRHCSARCRKRAARLRSARQTMDRGQGDGTTD